MVRRPRLGIIAYDYLPAVGGMGTYARALALHMDRAGYDVHLFSAENTQQEPPLTVHPILTTDLARDIPRLLPFKMDLWHAVNFGYAPVAFFKRPFVLTVHGTDFLTPWVRFTMDRLPGLWRLAPYLNARAGRRTVYLPAMRCVDQVLTCSRFSARLFRREYPSVRRLDVIPNGVGVDDLQSAKTLNASRHPRRMLTVCKLDTGNRRKNVDGCLRAFALVGHRLDLEYWIVGDGPEKPSLERLSRELGIADRVRFLGHISDEALREAYATASLFVLAPRPRPRDVEGFGIVYLEAAAMGTPSLASRCGGTVDAVREGISGFFTRDTSAEAIADGLERFFTGGIRFDAVTVREHARAHAWPTVLKRVECTYERLLGHTPAPRQTPMPVTGSAQVRVRPRPSCRPGAHWSEWISRDIHRPRRTRPRARALLISYMFPPTGGSAVQRPAKLVKYLPQLGWDTEVLTAAHDRFSWHDESLLSNVPRCSRIHRVAGWEPANVARRMASVLAFGQRHTTRQDQDATSRFHRFARSIEDALHWRLYQLFSRFGIKDPQSLWIGPAVRAAVRRHHQRPFDVVISTGPPQFVHLAAMRIARATGLPWVADIRDPLVSDFDRTPADLRRVQTMRRLERSIARRADRIVTTCSALTRQLRGRYPQRRAETIQTITNGFDRDDLRMAIGSSLRNTAPDQCVFVAAGSFYGRREISCIAGPLRDVLNRHPQWRDRVRLIIAGSLDQEQQRRWAGHAPEWLTLSGYVDHASAIRLAAEAACSIVVVPDCAHGRTSIPGKTFELLALPTHVLALVPARSETADIVRRAGASTIAPQENHQQVASALETIIADYFAGQLPSQRDWAALDVYDRQTVAVAWSDCLNLTGQPRATSWESTFSSEHNGETQRPIFDSPVHPGHEPTSKPRRPSPADTALEATRKQTPAYETVEVA